MTNSDGSSADEPAPALPPEPRYGQYSSTPVTPANPAYPGQVGPGMYAPAAAPRKPRTADVIVTCVLLVLALIGTGFGLIAAAILDNSLQMENLKYGVSYETPASLGGIQLLIVVSHIILFLVALGVSIPLMLKRRIAFWVPLVTGVIATIIFWVGLFALFLDDPALLQAIQAANGQ